MIEDDELHPASLEKQQAENVISDNVEEIEYVRDTVNTIRLEDEDRKNISERYSNQLAKSLSILYGGSVKPENSKDIFSLNDVDGGLIGGASLNAIDFNQIINSI